MLENVINDHDIESLLRCNPKVIDKTLRHYINNNTNNALCIIQTFELNIVGDIYIYDISRNSLSGTKRVKLRNQEIKFLEIISCIELIKNIGNDTNLSCQDVDTICSMIKLNIIK